MPFEQVKLNYAFDALEPHVDAKTMEIHYTKHHATYLKNLNTTVEKHPELFEKSLEALLVRSGKSPGRYPHGCSQ